MTEFRGVHTAPITPMTDSHRLNEDVPRKIVEFHIRAGIDGFWGPAAARASPSGAQSASTTPRSSPQLASPAAERGVARQISTSSSPWGALGVSR